MPTQTVPLCSKISVVLIGTVVAGLTSPSIAQDCNPSFSSKLLSDDGAENDFFGQAVSINENTAIIGVLKDDDNGTNSGSAYIFTLNDGVWTQQAKLLPDDGSAGDNFGFSVSVSADTAVIGAISDNFGSAYIFTRNGNLWTQQTKLHAADQNEDFQFGNSVSVHGDTVLVGAIGDNSAYVFTGSGKTWNQQAKLLPNDKTLYNGFGKSLSISGNSAVIGADQDSENGNAAGAAYVFQRSKGQWTQQAKLLPSDGASDDVFGVSVSLSNDSAVIGAHFDDDNGTSSGSAYVFSRNGNLWTQQAKLLPTDGAPNDEFGRSVSISDNIVIIGADLDDDRGSSSGSAYVFKRNETAWTQQPKISPFDGAMGDFFGVAVSISGNTAISGARFDDDNGFSSGSAYIFNLNCTDCPADLNSDATLDFADVSTFLTAFTDQDPIADFTADGIWNFFDISAFLTEFRSGCP